MLTAVATDFVEALPDGAVLTLLDASCPAPAGVRVRRCTGPDEEAKLFRRLVREADYTLVIAPEFDDLLWTRCCWVAEAGGRLLGPTLEAVRLSGDKLELSRHLRRQGIATPQCLPGPAPAPAFPLVWKPRCGAGSLATFLVRDAAELAACPARAAAEGFAGEAVVQPCVPGLAASAAFLRGPGGQLALRAGVQLLSPDGRFHYLGGQLPLQAPLEQRALALAARAVAAVPGLAGYIGVDLVLGAAADGSEDWVIEINPRLTTSYLGQRALCMGNLMTALLTLFRPANPAPLPVLSWRRGQVSFRTDGMVQADG